MAANDVSRTLWMGDLEPYMDEFFILQAFENMGEPAVQVKMINNKYTGLPAGYCFVDFADSESAQRAQLRLNGKIIPNSQPPHRFKLNSNQIKDCPKKEFSLFVGELSEEVDDYVLFRAFVKKYPSCHTAKVVLDSRGVSKGYGFVRFSEETEQQKALIEMQHTIGLGRKPIRVCLATPKKSGSTYEPPPGSFTGNVANYQSKAYQEYCQQYYQQYYNQYYASQQMGQTQQQTQYYNPNNEENALEEPELEIDVDKYNKEYMLQSEEIFDVLEDSRWHPMDQWNSTVPATAR